MFKAVGNAGSESDVGALRLGRRAWLKGTSLLLLASGTQLAQANALAVRARVGLVTDMHFADKPAAGTRYYRETLGKLEEAGKRFRDSPIDTLIELGDFIDAAESVELELKYLDEIQRSFRSCVMIVIMSLGNHCVDTLTKEEFLNGVGQEKSFYSFDRNETHFVVLDACFRSDGTAYGRKNFQWTDANIPQEEIRWLKDDLAKTEYPTIVLAHQRLDPSGNHEIKNSAEVRAILEASVRFAWFCKATVTKMTCRIISGIHYCTLVAMVEGSGVDSNGYSILEILDDGTYRLEGFRQQKSYTW